MLNNRFIERVKTETEILFKKLQYLENLLIEWTQLQRQWIYLENIFNSADIASKMGQDAKRFSHVDTMWKEIMKQTNANPSVLKMIQGYVQPYLSGTNIMLFLSS